MKKQNKKLQLNKDTIAKLNDDSMSQIRGGVINKGNNGGAVAYFSGGCSDGCGPFRTAWNCTEADCTNNCPTKIPRCCSVADCMTDGCTYQKCAPRP